MRFLGKERGVDAAIDDAGSALAGKLPYLVAAQRVAGVDPDTDYIACLDRLRIQLLQSFVNDVRIAEVTGCGGCQHVEPARGYHTDSKGRITRIDEMDLQQGSRDYGSRFGER